MAESADIAVIDGEDAGSTPFEFDSVLEDAGTGITVDASARLHGNYGYKFSFNGAGGADTCFGTKSLGDITEVYARIYFYYPSTGWPNSTNNPARTQQILRINNSGIAGSYASIIEVRGGVGADPPTVYYLYYRTDAGATGTSMGNAITLGAKQYLELHHKCANGTGALQIWLNGTSIKSITGLSNAATVLSEVRVGYSSSYPPANGEYFYVDNVLLSTTGPIGAYTFSYDKTKAVFTSRAPSVTFTGG